jgi:uncharacterized protein (UPF0212 family)
MCSMVYRDQVDDVIDRFVAETRGALKDLGLTLVRIEIGSDAGYKVYVEEQATHAHALSVGESSGYRVTIAYGDRWKAYFHFGR